MDKQKLAGLALKLAVGAVVSAGIGYAIKGEKMLKELIDEKFADTVTDIIQP